MHARRRALRTLPCLAASSEGTAAADSWHACSPRARALRPQRRTPPCARAARRSSLGPQGLLSAMPAAGWAAPEPAMRARGGLIRPCLSKAMPHPCPQPLNSRKVRSTLRCQCMCSAMQPAHVLSDLYLVPQLYNLITDGFIPDALSQASKASDRVRHNYPRGQAYCTPNGGFGGEYLRWPRRR